MTRSAPAVAARPAAGLRDPALVRLGTWSGWPTGLVLALAHAAGGLPTPAFGALAFAYVAGTVLLVRRRGGLRDRPAAALVLTSVGVFALAGFTGPPTARLPATMLANAAVLLAAAVALLVAAVVLALRVAPEGRVPATLGVVALVVGSSGYLLNLLARAAVVASGAASQQVAVEDSAWVASAYLNGLAPEPTYLAFALVWLDLMQLAYVVLAYLGFAGLATGLGRAGSGTAPAERTVARWGVVLAAFTVAAAVGAALLPGTAGSVGAWAAFVLTIPFMSTLLPYGMGMALLRRSTTSATSATGTPAGAGGPALLPGFACRSGATVREPSPRGKFALRADPPTSVLPDRTASRAPAALDRRGDVDQGPR